MIIVKIVNQRVVQVAFSASGRQRHQLIGQLLAQEQKQLGIFARTLVQSASQKQKVTSANNQQLIPVARNISFRQCQLTEQHKRGNTARASYSIASNSGAAHFLAAEPEPYIIIGEQEAAIEEQRESPLDMLKRRAKDAREKRDLINKSKYYGQQFNEAASALLSERRLVVLLSWLEAKEKHIEKYREFYLKRGFDVLNVKTTPLDILLPNRGAKKISEDFVRFMNEKQYSNVVFHGFSVGGYMFGRCLLEIEQLDAESRQKMLKSIRGLVFDSLVTVEGVAVGVANSITPNKFGAKAIENVLRAYLYAGHNFATKYYLEVSDKVWTDPLRCPTLFMHSKDDRISDHKIIEKLANTWTSLGVECEQMMVDSSPHVQLFTKHHDQYCNRVNKFLEHIKVL